MQKSCPVCSETISVDDDIELSEVIVCEHCDAELEVVAVDPLNLAPFEEEEK